MAALKSMTSCVKLELKKWSRFRKQASGAADISCKAVLKHTKNTHNRTGVDVVWVAVVVLRLQGDPGMIVCNICINHQRAYSLLPVSVFSPIKQQQEVEAGNCRRNSIRAGWRWRSNSWQQRFKLILFQLQSVQLLAKAAIEQHGSQETFILPVMF